VASPKETNVSYKFFHHLWFSPCGNYLRGEAPDGEFFQFCPSSFGISLDAELLRASKYSVCDDNHSRTSEVSSLAKRLAEDRVIGRGLVPQSVPLTVGGATVTVGQTGHRALRALEVTQDGNLSLAEIDQSGRVTTRSVSRLPASVIKRSKRIQVASTDHAGGAIIIFTSKPQERYEISQPAKAEDYAAVYRREEEELQP
jgi:hypothetical protein